MKNEGKRYARVGDERRELGAKLTNQQDRGKSDGKRRTVGKGNGKGRFNNGVQIVGDGDEGMMKSRGRQEGSVKNTVGMNFVGDVFN